MGSHFLLYQFVKGMFNLDLFKSKNPFSIFLKSESESFPDNSVGKELPEMLETPVRFLCLEDSLEKGEATHSSILRLPLLLSW